MPKFAVHAAHKQDPPTRCFQTPGVVMHVTAFACCPCRMGMMNAAFMTQPSIKQHSSRICSATDKEKEAMGCNAPTAASAGSVLLHSVTSC
jgi:hypothetical protein